MKKKKSRFFPIAILTCYTGINYTAPRHLKYWQGGIIKMWEETGIHEDNKHLYACGQTQFSLATDRALVETPHK